MDSPGKNFQCFALPSSEIPFPTIEKIIIHTVNGSYKGNKRITLPTIEKIIIHTVNGSYKGNKRITLLSEEG